MHGRSIPSFIFVSGADGQAKQQITRRAIIGSTIGIVVGGGIIGTALYSQNLEASIQASALQSIPYTYRGHQETVLSAVCSPNGKLIASASPDGTVHVWTTKTSH